MLKFIFKIVLTIFALILILATFQRVSPVQIFEEMVAGAKELWMHLVSLV